MKQAVQPMAKRMAAWSSKDFSYSIMVRNLKDPDAAAGLDNGVVVALGDAIE